ncbi:MAG: hypothetical protein Q9218_002366 [Villophora microphyllina]
MSEIEQVQFREWVETSKGFSEDERKALNIDSADTFNEFWTDANKAKESFDRGHEKGCGLWGRHYQDSAALILPFMNDFSPIIQVVKDFGAPYGGIAVGAIFAHKGDEVQEHIVQIRRLCEELLNKNVDSIKRLNLQLKEDNAELQSKIAELQKGHDYDRLNEVQRSLDLNDFSEEQHYEDWNKHCQAVRIDDDLNSELLQQMRGPGLDTFRACDDYQTWSSSKQPCLLVLSGHNDISIDGPYQCWVSPLAAATVEDFGQRENPPIYAYYALTQNGKILYDVLPVILLQLLRTKASVLRDEQRYAELRTQLGKLQQVSIGENDRVSAMEKTAIRVVEFFTESETIYIVVDRADRCRDIKKADHRKTLLRCLVQMVEAARCKLRILVVIDGRSWRVENYRDDLGVKIEERFIMCTAEQRLKEQ